MREHLEAENRRLRHELQSLQSRQRLVLQTIAQLRDKIVRMQPDFTIAQAALLFAHLESLRLLPAGEVLPC